MLLLMVGSKRVKGNLLYKRIFFVTVIFYTKTTQIFITFINYFQIYVIFIWNTVKYRLRNFFEKKVNSQKPLILFAKLSIMDV